MNLTFQFSAPTQIEFGAGRARTVMAEIKHFGSKVLLVCGKNHQRHHELARQLQANAVRFEPFEVDGEPDTVLVEKGLLRARQIGCDVVVGLGGGSAIDSAKTIAALINNSGSLLDYLEVIGSGRPLENPPVACIAIPTTAGTGAEVTRNAVLASPAHRIKVSLRGPQLMPRLAVIDPTLALSLPPLLTAATGMDALTQLVEAFVSRKANPLTDALCREGIPRAARALPVAVDSGGNLQPRIEMAIASLFSGMALANGGLGAVHGIAGPLGGYKPMPHGTACAALLAPVFEANARLLGKRCPAGHQLDRFCEAARLLTGDPQASVADGVRWLYKLQHRLGLPMLDQFNLSDDDLAVVAKNACNASSMRGNPVMLDNPAIIDILKRAMELNC
jgi:alcohol dehydrogenase class IV